MVSKPGVYTYLESVEIHMFEIQPRFTGWMFRTEPVGRGFYKTGRIFQ